MLGHRRDKFFMVMKITIATILIERKVGYLFIFITDEKFCPSCVIPDHNFDNDVF
jgi:hypothetical protein